MNLILRKVEKIIFELPESIMPERPTRSTKINKNIILYKLFIRQFIIIMKD